MSNRYKPRGKASEPDRDGGRERGERLGRLSKNGHDVSLETSTAHRDARYRTELDVARVPVRVLVIGERQRAYRKQTAAGGKRRDSELRAGRDRQHQSTVAVAERIGLDEEAIGLQIVPEPEPPVALVVVDAAIDVITQTPDREAPLLTVGVRD